MTECEDKITSSKIPKGITSAVFVVAVARFDRTHRRRFADPRGTTDLQKTDVSVTSAVGGPAVGRPPSRAVPHNIYAYKTHGYFVIVIE